MVFCQLSRALHEFSFLLHDMSMGFIRAGNHGDLFLQFCEELCMHWQLDLD